MRARIPPLILVGVGLALTAGFANAWHAAAGSAITTPWWAFLFLLLMSIAMLALAGAVTIDPRPLPLRRALGGCALAWLVILTWAFFAGADTGRRPDIWLPFVLAVITGLALAGIARTTSDVSDERQGPIQRFVAVVAFGAAILMAAGALVLATSLARAVWRAITQGDPLDRIPWGLVVLIVFLPVVTFLIATIGSHRAAGRTFHAQASANRRNGVLLVVSLVGIVAAVAEIIMASLTLDPVPALWAAGAAALLGVGAAVGTNRFGSSLILQTAGATLADPKSDAVLLDVVRELSIAADIPAPTTYIVRDDSPNAFATGRDPKHAAIVVTSGLVTTMDREQLQGVIAHELGHIRNLDTRYALYIAVFVGLVALVTDGFLRAVVEGWKNGAFTQSSDDDNALAGLAMSLLVGTFLLLVAVLLRLVAPLFALLIQASSSREREFLADATSVEFTRNARGLERALESLAGDHDPLEAANRGMQHMWFRNPLKEDVDRRIGLLSTHPSLAARIDRLRALQGLDPMARPVAAD